MERGEKLEMKTHRKYPPISVIIPTFNNEKTIGRTLNSIKKQHYPGEIEICVVDDKSRDKTLEILK